MLAGCVRQPYEPLQLKAKNSFVRRSLLVLRGMLPLQQTLFQAKGTPECLAFSL